MNGHEGHGGDGGGGGKAGGGGAGGGGAPPRVPSSVAECGIGGTELMSLSARSENVGKDLAAWQVTLY